MIVINSNTRQFNIPASDLVFGVESDAGSERKWFQCPRYVGDNLDLASCFVRMNYRNANGEMDSYLVDDVTIDGENAKFSWVLSQKAVQYKGQVKFVVCAVGPNQKVEWHTTIGTGMVLEGLEPDASIVESATSDVVAQLVAMVEAQTVAVEKVGGEQVAVVEAAAKAAETASVAQIEAKGVNTLASIPEDYTALSNAVRGLAGAIVCEAEGEAITLSDSSNLPMQGLRIFGRSTQDGTPTPEDPVEIVSIVNPTISVDEQTLALTHTLPGIPVTSGGNYTDSDGQQWICDEVDLERGVYVQRLRNQVFTGTERITNNWFPIAVYEINNAYDHVNLEYNDVRSSHFEHVYCGNTVGTTLAIGSLDKIGFTSVDELKVFFAEQYAQGTPVVIQYVLATPIETPLSETELAAYRALHTNKPNTTVLNDAGAHMAVKYVADTKLYIDNKIAALTA